MAVLVLQHSNQNAPLQQHRENCVVVRLGVLASRRLGFPKTRQFHNGCLRKICRIFWPRVFTNEDLYVKTNSEPMIRTVQKRRLKWLGHVLRMPSERIPKVALPSQGKRSRGKPKTTWRRGFEKELETMKLTWGEAEAAAKDRIAWRQRVEASCSARS